MKKETMKKETTGKIATVETTPCGNFAVRLSSGDYVAEQGGRTWNQDTPQGWALFVTRDEAGRIANRVNRQG